MNEYRVIEQEEIIDDIQLTTYSVVDSEGYPINNGCFTIKADAEYVALEMETGNYLGDRVSDLSKGMSSWIQN